MPLAQFTTFGVGGPARYFAEAATEADIRDALRFAAAERIPLLVLGGGSNLLVADRGVDALVLRPTLQGVDVELPAAGPALVRAAAGEPWDGLVARAVAEGFAGIECLSGIPGNVGATPIQNVGAYGQEVAETIVEVQVIERATGASIVLAGADCGFRYRDSHFKQGWRDRFVITAVTFALRPGAPPALRYPELTRALGIAAGSPPPRPDSAAPSLAEVRDTVLALRRAKSMLLDPSDENGKSAGSFFTNPTLGAARFEAAAARIKAAGVLNPGESFPSYPAGDGRVKLSAAWLIERAGFPKGTRHGAAGVSTRHTLSLVNRGGATAAEVVALARRVQRGVLARFGVTLTAEAELVGFDSADIDDLVPSAPGSSP